ncbi:hypothetical protein Fokcrypt_00178 [Candidatus Fokinia cryptica]|uniref:Uncharacterized protein n=1 Tax=Candidatus Fokinia crypta TaxID=1920990 RepID=A0ABZ0UPP7_9RICK|nr:hypothetical protein Fokcrypt_00178 [Candidatus Fokinia cryptica]
MDDIGDRDDNMANARMLIKYEDEASLLLHLQY